MRPSEWLKAKGWKVMPDEKSAHETLDGQWLDPETNALLSFIGAMETQSKREPDQDDFYPYCTCPLEHKPEVKICGICEKPIRSSE